MRTFVILLLLANLAYFGWTRGWLRDMPAPPAPELAADSLPPFTAVGERLTLLAEADPQITPQVAIGQPPVTTGLTTTGLATTGLATGGLTTGQPLSPEASDVAIATELPLESDAADTGQPLSPGTDIAMGQPLNEEASETPQSPALPGPRWCGELGLFTAAGPAEALLPELLLLGIDAELVAGRRPVGNTFWVHSRLFEREADALALLRELQGQNIDSYYIREGELAGRISLGVFSRNSSAEQVQSTLAAQGYSAEISRVARQVDRFWLDLEFASSAVLESPEWLALVARLASSGGEAGAVAADAPQLTEKVCNAVATPG